MERCSAGISFPSPVFRGRIVPPLCRVASSSLWQRRSLSSFPPLPLLALSCSLYSLTGVSFCKAMVSTAPCGVLLSRSSRGAELGCWQLVSPYLWKQAQCCCSSNALLCNCWGFPQGFQISSHWTAIWDFVSAFISIRWSKAYPPAKLHFR